MTPDEPGYASRVVRALVAPPTAQELVGQDEACQAFRAAQRHTIRRGLRVVSGTGMTVAASSIVLSMTVVTAAAYTAVLPHEMQHVAHRLLHRIGVPDPHEEHVAARAVTVPPDHDTPTPKPVRAASPPPPVLLTHLVAQLVVVGSDARVALITRNVATGATAILQTRSPDAREWTVTGRARVDAHHDAWTVIPRVPSSLELRWIVPDMRAASPTVLLQARPQLAATPSSSTVSAGTTAVLNVLTSPDQRGRRVVLEKLIAGKWVELATVTLDGTGRASTPLETHHSEVDRLRFVLPGTSRYAPSASSVFTVTVR